MSQIVVGNPWRYLRQFTNARIALGRTGCSLPTRELLTFELMRGRARDAVYASFVTGDIVGGLTEAGLPSIVVRSAARDRAEYLRRPDLGGILNSESRVKIEERREVASPDVVFVIADGLSPAAPMRHALPVVRTTITKLAGLRIGPIIIAEQARVALGDRIGEHMGAGLVVILIGERPGLSSPASLGIYITSNPRTDCTNDQRNCISNIHPGGMSDELAAQKLCELIVGARRLGTTGIGLKNSDQGVNPFTFPRPPHET